MTELLRLQMEFTKHSAQLVPKAIELGYGVVWGEVARSDEQAEINALGGVGRTGLVRYLSMDGAWQALARAIENNTGSGIRRSLHRLCLAVDLKLFKDDTYLTYTQSYLPLGEWWELQHPLARWGGHFGDGGHFSFEWKGIK